MRYLYWETEADISTLNNRYKILIYILLITTSAFAAFLVVKNIKLTPDSLRYGLVSEQILTGHGIRLPVTRLLADNMVPTDGTIPFLEQAPLLPILIALLGGITPDSVFAGQALNLICHVIIAIFSFLIMNKFCNKGIALLTGILVAFSYPLLRLTDRIASEPLFIALTGLSIYFLISCHSSNRTQFVRNIFLGSICTSAAISARWAGITLIPIFFWILWNIYRNNKSKSYYVLTIIAAAIPVLFTTSLLIRNYIYSGTIRGWYQPSAGRSFLEAFTGTIKMTLLQFQLGPRPIILIVVFLLIFILSILVSTNIRREFSKLFHSGMDVVLIFTINYMALIIFALAQKQPVFELRFVGPLVPFLYITAIVIMVYMWKAIELRDLSRVSLTGLVLSIGILTSVSFYKTYINFPEFSYKSDKYHSFLNSCTYKWIKTNYQENILITTNQAYPLSFYGRYSTVTLPHKRFNKNIQIPDNMESVLPNRMSEFGSRILVLFSKVEAQYDGNYVAELFNKRGDDDKFGLVHECQDGVVYKTIK